MDVTGYQNLDQISKLPRAYYICLDGCEVKDLSLGIVKWDGM